MVLRWFDMVVYDVTRQRVQPESRQTGIKCYSDATSGLRVSVAPHGLTVAVILSHTGFPGAKSHVCGVNVYMGSL